MTENRTKCQGDCVGFKEGALLWNKLFDMFRKWDVKICTTTGIVPCLTRGSLSDPLSGRADGHRQECLRYFSYPGAPVGCVSTG
jgi:hypothetical protein